MINIEAINLQESSDTADSNIESLTTGALDGTGVFDKLLQSTKLHLQEEYDRGRITGQEYTTVYLGSLTAVLQQSVQFLLNNKTHEKIGAEIALIRQQTVTELVKTDNLIPAGLGFNDSTAVEGAVAGELLKLTAETTKITTENSHITQDTLRLEAQTDLVIAQENLTTEDATRVLNEGLRIAQETLRIAQAKTNLTAEFTKIENEADRIEADTSRISKDGLRIDAETLKIGYESTKINEEKSYVTQDIQRITADTSRVAQETLRLIQDTSKVEEEIDLLAAKIITEGKQQDKLENEYHLLAQQVVTELAQTYGTIPNTDIGQLYVASYSVAGVIGGQATLYETQAEGYLRDARYKYTKAILDTFSIGLTSTGLDWPVSGELTETNMNGILTSMSTDLSL